MGETMEIVVDMIVSVNGQEPLKQSKFENPRFMYFSHPIRSFYSH